VLMGVLSIPLAGLQALTGLLSRSMPADDP
jgi:hypothetical protein